ncbi:MAG: hypothetical protein V4736_09675 [Bdellovibrionota bacterium]
MDIYCRIMTPTDTDEVMDFENRKLVDSHPDEMERSIASWHARWRRESLDHYMALGWSFLVRDREVPSQYSNEGLLIGYFIAQPLLFVDGNTQSLWVEHLSYSSLKARDELCDLAYRLSREKHFQKVIFPSNTGVMNALNGHKPETWQPQTIALRTTKT